MTDNPFDGFVTIPEAAEITKKHEQTIRKWIRQGVLRVYRSGRDPYVKVADLAPKPVPQPERRP